MSAADLPTGPRVNVAASAAREISAISSHMLDFDYDDASQQTLVRSLLVRIHQLANGSISALEDGVDDPQRLLRRLFAVKSGVKQ